MSSAEDAAIDRSATAVTRSCLTKSRKRRHGARAGCATIGLAHMLYNLAASRTLATLGEGAQRAKRAPWPHVLGLPLQGDVRLPVAEFAPGCLVMCRVLRQLIC